MVRFPAGGQQRQEHSPAQCGSEIDRDQSKTYASHQPAPKAHLNSDRLHVWFDRCS